MNNKKLYYHKTDGGAEYLCTSPVEGTDEGDVWTTIIRLDGEPELINTAIPATNEMLQVLEGVERYLDRMGLAPSLLSEVRAVIAKATS